MGNNNTGGFFSKVLKVIANPRSSRYIDKLLFIVNKHWQKHARGRRNLPSRHSAVSIESSNPIYISLDHIPGASIDSQDSGVMVHTVFEGPYVPPRKTITTTTAVIEPVPSRFCNSSPISQKKSEDSQFVEPDSATLWGSSIHWNSTLTSPEVSVRSPFKAPEDIVVLEDSIELVESEPETSGVKANVKKLHDLFTDTNDERNQSERETEQKFLVNIFESRQSARWERKGIFIENLFNNVKCMENKTKEVRQDQPAVCENGKDLVSASNAMFFKLRKLRDVECVKMREASNALMEIKKMKDSDVANELLAERILLETELKYKLLVSKIRQVNFNGVKPQPKHSAVVTLSNFQYELLPQSTKSCKYSTNYYVLAVLHGTDVFMSKAITAADGKLTFNETFSIPNLDENFKIDVRVFTINLRTRKPEVTSCMKKKRKTCCPMFTIYYENVNTQEMQESSISVPSFSCCTELSITKDQITDKSISQLPNNLYLRNDFRVTVNVNLELNSSLFGFLTVGVRFDDNENIFWERKWCCLQNNLLSLYNYPQEQEDGQSPMTLINLEYCILPFEKSMKNFSRKRTFVLKTGRPRTLNDSNCTSFRKRKHFILRKYYFTADNCTDFEMWTSELASVLDCLNHWKRLILVDDTYERLE